MSGYDQGGGIFGHLNDWGAQLAYDGGTRYATFGREICH